MEVSKMASPPKSRLQSMLQAAVQTVRWTYSLFWQLCPQQRLLVWSDGYYNGAIKTRKTVQPTEVTTEEATLHRSQQLKELYESLCTGETSHQTPRPSTALSPEDLTESEWFYLLCASFSFPPGVGLPGKVYAKGQHHIWLTGADESDNKIFSRAILAKSAGIQTVVCIPLLGGVVELGTSERVEEDVGVIRRIKSFFKVDGQNPNYSVHTPRQALSEHSTSNPLSFSEPRFHSPPMLPTRSPVHQAPDNSHLEDEDDKDESDSSDAKAAGQSNGLASSGQDVELASPDDDSNNLCSSDCHVAGEVPVLQSSYRAQENHKQPPEDPLPGQPPHSGNPSLELLTQEDTHYSQTVSTILETKSNRWSNSSSTTIYSAAITAFTKWSATHRDHHFLDGASQSQSALKHIVFTVPLLHTNSSSNDHTTTTNPHMRQSNAPQDELSANHVLAERRRREKLNERFVILRSLVPFVTRMDKASILGDTIEYVKQLRKRVQELESKNSDPKGRRDRRKLRIVEVGGGVGKGVAVAEGVEKVLEVSIIESDVLVEIECLNREGLLLDVMQVLKSEFMIEVTNVQSCVSDHGVFAAELRAKVKEKVNGRKASIMEVKRSINQVILHP